MSTPKPFVSDEYLRTIAPDPNWPDGPAWYPSSTQVRDLYEPHVQQLVRERDEALAKVAWISVEDKRPDRFDTVLTFGELGVIVCRYANGIWRHWESDRENKHEVTHWTPLPLSPNTPPSNG